MKFDKIQTPERFNIKKLTVEDAEKYKQIRLKGLQTDFASFGDTWENESKKDDKYWEEKISKPGRSFYAAEDKDIFVSTAGTVDNTSEKSTIIAVYTLPEYRGKNLSTQIINQIINNAKQKRLKRIQLHVNADNIEALKVYEKIGFNVISTEKGKLRGDGKLHDSHTMEKIL